ncbi:MAG: biotin/lipoyl-containing protein [Pseudomonadota bacterium]
MTLLILEQILNGVQLSYRGIAAPFYVYTDTEAAMARMMPERVVPDTSNMLLCPMPGLVKSVAVRVGDQVQAGDALCVVEAMKMENILRAERDATIAAVHAGEGDSLAVDAVIMEFEA